MEKIKKLYFVDSENVGLKSLGFKPTEGLCVIYIINNKCKMRTLAEYERVIKVPHDGSKNALDFIIATEIGSHIVKHGKKVEYFIVSNDKGFDNIVDYWRNNGINKISRITKDYIVSESENKASDEWGKLTQKEKTKVNNVYASYLKAKNKKYDALYKCIKCVLQKRHDDKTITYVAKMFWQLMNHMQ
jgi:hypothetical protein